MENTGVSNSINEGSVSYYGYLLAGVVMADISQIYNALNEWQLNYDSKQNIVLSLYNADSSTNVENNN